MTIDADKVRRLEDALLHALHDPKGNCNSHEVLDALLTATAATIFYCADDKGARLAALLEQWQDNLRDRILRYDHTTAFHDYEDGIELEEEEDTEDD